MYHLNGIFLMYHQDGTFLILCIILMVVPPRWYPCIAIRTTKMVLYSLCCSLPGCEKLCRSEKTMADALALQHWSRYGRAYDGCFYPNKPREDM